MKAVLVAALVFAAYCFAGSVDYQEALALEASRKEVADWMHENCIASQPNQRGVSEIRPDGSIQCSKYENAGGQRVPRLLFDEVRKWKP